MKPFKHLTVEVDPDGKVHRRVQTSEYLPENELLVKVAYSSLNYKDALASNGNRGISRFYPHIPGIDAAGVVEKSNHPDFKPGQKVIVSGYDLGMNSKGGFSQYISVPAAWAIPLPSGLSLKESMILGTAGLTTAMALDKILPHQPQKILVTGASGSVGSICILLLNKLGIEVVALSRKDPKTLLELGANEVIKPWTPSEKPLLKGEFDAAIDTVGGATLSHLIKTIRPYGAIAVCGMAQSPHFESSVYPFILRGVTLYGIESAEAPLEWKRELWDKLANIWKLPNLEKITRTVTLDTLETEIQDMLAGKAQGRVLIDLETELE